MKSRYTVEFRSGSQWIYDRDFDKLQDAFIYASEETKALRMSHRVVEVLGSYEPETP